MITEKLELPLKIVFPRNLLGGIIPGKKDTNFTILGLGDMAIPSMLLALVLLFDYRKSKELDNALDMLSTKGFKYIRYAHFGYAVGLVTTSAAAILTDSAQPALLYLVPFTLGPVLLISWMRKEFLELWEGSPLKNSDKIRHRIHEE